MFAKGLCEAGNSAVILNNKKSSERGYNLIINNLNFIGHFAELCDSIIINRTNPKGFINFNKPIYYYSHDAYDQKITHWMADKDLVNKITKILCVSNWQRDTFIKYFNVDPNKLEVIGNSLDISLYTGYVKRDPNKLIFASIPYKGLEMMHYIINDLIKITNNDQLKLHLFSSMSLYGHDERNQEYADIFRELDKNPNIVLRNPVSMKELAFEFQTSNLYVHPNLYHETFGMIFTQSQAAGCIPITTNYGAVNEVIYNKKNITKQPNVLLHETYDDFINLIVNKLSTDKDELYKERIDAQDFIRQFNYNKISQRFLNILN